MAGIFWYKKRLLLHERYILLPVSANRSPWHLIDWERHNYQEGKRKNENSRWAQTFFTGREGKTLFP